MITADQVLCHMVGDYLLQSDWMAQRKTSSLMVALVHAVTYCIPFAVLLWLTGGSSSRWWGLVVVGGTHLIIDRYRLARYLCWVKNFIAPGWIDTGKERRIPNHPDHPYAGSYLEPILVRNHSWADCKGTGYHSGRAAWLTTWLMIITDNTVHVLINGLALWYFSAV